MWPHIPSTDLSGGVIFDASFDGGNCASVQQVGEDEFDLSTSNDCQNTPYEKGMRTWFQFSVRGVAKGRYLAFNIYNMNCQGKLFRADMRPAYRSLPSILSWFRLQGYTSLPNPTHYEIQKVLVDHCGQDAGSLLGIVFETVLPLGVVEPGLKDRVTGERQRLAAGLQAHDAVTGCVAACAPDQHPGGHLVLLLQRGPFPSPK